MLFSLLLITCKKSEFDNNKENSSSATKKTNIITALPLSFADSVINKNKNKSGFKSASSCSQYLSIVFSNGSYSDYDIVASICESGNSYHWQLYRSNGILDSDFDPTYFPYFNQSIMFRLSSAVSGSYYFKVIIDDNIIVYTSRFTIPLSFPFNFGFQWLNEPFNYSAYNFNVGDVSGDGKSDIIGINKNNDRFVVWTSYGSSFSGGQEWLNEPFNYSGYDFILGDVNGDKKSDVFAVAKDDERFVVWSSNGNSFNGGREWMNGPFNYSAYTFYLGDVNGDGMSDVIGIRDHDAMSFS